MKLKYLCTACLTALLFFTGCAASGADVVADSVQKVDLNINALEKLSTSSGSGNFNIYLAKDDIPYVEMKNKIRGLHLGPTPSLIVEETGNSTDIRISGSGWLTIGSVQTEINLYLPENTVKDLKVGIGSGYFYCDELNLENLEFHLASGYANMDMVSADSMLLHVDSGNLGLYNAEADEMEIKISSGGINVETFGDPTALKASISSGYLSFDGGISQGELKCSSGTLDVASSILPETLDCMVSSGDVYLALPQKEAEDTGFTVSYKVSSGDFYNGFPHLDNDKKDKQVTGKGEKEYNFKIASGSVTLTQHEDD